ncbi:alpha/beta hydrolase [Nocardioides ferulae]|uniref:alpha/beta hydrolase n=1 Tax=Nocardioides ferulae TaxID=2340821 RepID=UPI00197DB307|nr:alpha/beta hydrolase [Nocardioides ferulae]
MQNATATRGTAPAAGLDEAQIQTTLATMAESFVSWPRSPIYHRPDEAGLAYEEVTFPSADGVPLEGWYLPAEGSDKLVIANHPRWFNRSGLASHLEPWSRFGAATGNDIEVNFIPDYKLLHDAGYHVLAYDLRNFGQSGVGNGGVFTVGRFEARDVLGSLAYVRTRPDTRDLTVGLFSRCVGANASMFAMMQDPAAFDGVRCMVAPQPLSAGVALARAMDRLGIPAERIGDLDEQVFRRTSFHLDELSPAPWARHVTVPTLLYQVRDDVYTTPSDVQAIYDNIPLEDKSLFWIGGTTRRWDGYTYFQREPDRILEWFDSHMA